MASRRSSANQEEGACICPAVMHYKLAPQTEVEILEALMRMPNGRAAQ
jgi:hypothetical protein